VALFSGSPSAPRDQEDQCISYRYYGEKWALLINLSSSMMALLSEVTRRSERSMEPISLTRTSAQRLQNSPSEETGRNGGDSLRSFWCVKDEMRRGRRQIDD